MVRTTPIICVRNRRHEIERSMTSALASGKQKIIVVDSLSTDGTVEIAGHLADGIISDDGKGLASSRQGALATKTDYIAYHDSDTEIPEIAYFRRRSRK